MERRAFLFDGAGAILALPLGTRQAPGKIGTSEVCAAKAVVTTPYAHDHDHGSAPLRLRAAGADHLLPEPASIGPSAPPAPNRLAEAGFEAADLGGEPSGAGVGRQEVGIGGPDDTERLKARITPLEQQVADLELKLQDQGDELNAARTTISRTHGPAQPRSRPAALKAQARPPLSGP